MGRAVFVLCVVASAFFAPSKALSRDYGLAGCGLGSMVMGKSGGQVSAATTNDTSYSQVGGITSGTSNCELDDDGKTAINIQQQHFVMRNLATLQKEVAQGKGETLAAFSESLGCDKEVYPEFTSELKRSYSDLFSSPGAIAVLDTAKQRLKQNPELVESCHYLYDI